MRYLNSKGNVTTAQTSLDTAKSKRQALYDPPTQDELDTLNAAIRNTTIALDTARGNIKTSEGSIETARASIASAQAKLASLTDPATNASAVASAQQTLKQAQQSLATAQDNLTNLVLRAPFDGQVAAIALNVGDQVGAATAIPTFEIE